MPELLPPPTAGGCDSVGAASGLDWWWGLGLGCIYPLTVYELFPYQQPGWGPRDGRGAPPHSMPGAGGAGMQLGVGGRWWWRGGGGMGC